MEQGSENGLIILTDGALTKPTQNAEGTEEGCTCWKRGAFPSCQPSGAWQVPHWPSSLAAFQSSELEQIPFVTWSIPCLLPLLILPSCNILKEAQKVSSVSSIGFFLMQKHVKAKQNKKQALLIRAV